MLKVTHALPNPYCPYFQPTNRLNNLLDPHSCTYQTRLPSTLQPVQNHVTCAPTHPCIKQGLAGLTQLNLLQHSFNGWRAASNVRIGLNANGLSMLTSLKVGGQRRMTWTTVLLLPRLLPNQFTVHC